MERVTLPQKIARAFLLNNLRARLILLVLIAILPIFGLVLIGALEQINIERKQVKENLLQLARLVAANHEQTLEGTHQLLIVLASSNQVRGGDPLECSSFLAQVNTRNRGYALLAVSDLEGNITCSSLPVEKPVNINDRAYFQQALLLNRFSIGEYQIGRITKKPSIGLAKQFGIPGSSNPSPRTRMRGHLKPPAWMTIRSACTRSSACTLSHPPG